MPKPIFMPKSTSTLDSISNPNRTDLQALSPQQLKRCTDPKFLPKTSQQASALDIHLGQSRAVKAIRTALAIKARGYNVFASGENGLGKRTLITRLLQEHAKSLPTPDDWVYVYNFDNPREPLALRLSAGAGEQLQQSVQNLWLTVKQTLSKRFRSDSYQRQLESIRNQLQTQETQIYDELNAEAKTYNLILQFRTTDNQPTFIPIIAENEDSTSPIDDNRLSKDKNHLLKRFNQMTIRLEQLEDETNSAIEELHKSIASRAIEPIVAPIIEQFTQQFSNITPAIDYLHRIQADMIEHVERIVNQDDEEFMVNSLATVPIRYCVNIINSHRPDSGAPIVFEDMPTHLNLLGHVEQITHLGTVTTDVSLIRAGSLHRANGGFLLLEANSLLEHPYAWQGLKRALQSKQIKLSSLEQILTLTGSLSLAPSPIELDVKVILLGEASLYYELIAFEPEFNAVFKIRADFHDSVLRTSDSEQAMSSKIADIVNDKQLLPFDNLAQATIIDYLSLLADDQNRLSLH